MIALTWTDPAPPNGKTCFYDHVTAETPLGQYRIEWKSWKRYDAYVLSGPPADDVIESETNLDDAKACAQKHFDALVSACMVHNVQTATSFDSVPTLRKEAVTPTVASDLREAVSDEMVKAFKLDFHTATTRSDYDESVRSALAAALAASPASKPDEAPDVLYRLLVYGERIKADSFGAVDGTLFRFKDGKYFFLADTDLAALQSERRKREEAEAEIVKLRRLDAKYGRVESAIIMADPDFDGDSNHANCGDRLIASVNRLADKARP